METKNKLTVTEGRGEMDNGAKKKKNSIYTNLYNRDMRNITKGLTFLSMEFQ